MKKFILFLGMAALSTASLVSCNNTTETTTTEESTGLSGEYAVEASGSEVAWKGEMLGLYSHEGTVKLNSGNLTLEDGKVASGKFEVSLTTITPTDSAYNEENTAEKLVGHLSSDDFFNVEKFPTASFEVTGVEGTTVNGNLTVRGITNPEKVENVSVSEENGVTTVTGDLVFDRTKYDVKFKMPVADKVLSDNISIKVKLNITK